MSTYLNKRAKELGLEVVDATKPMLVSVNQKDVARAKVKNPEDCALARACKRQHDGVKAAYFFRTAAYLEYDDKLVRYVLPHSAQKEIVAFDRAKVFEPGNYQLTPPSSTNTLKAVKRRSKRQRANGRTPRGVSSISRKFKHTTTNVRAALNPNGVGGK